MKTGNKNVPACFGDLDKVFPKEEDGLRHSPETCLECAHKTECLRSAMQGDQGLRVREEKVDRAYSSGMLSFFERWSRKKELDARRKQEDKEKE
ncbi:MAG: hypothetical protein ABFS43_20075 [Thermodesulfobacteriota bacterium]